MNADDVVWPANDQAESVSTPSPSPELNLLNASILTSDLRSTAFPPKEGKRPIPTSVCSEPCKAGEIMISQAVSAAGRGRPRQADGPSQLSQLTELSLPAGRHLLLGVPALPEIRVRQGCEDVRGLWFREVACGKLLFLLRSRASGEINRRFRFSTSVSGEAGVARFCSTCAGIRCSPSCPCASAASEWS